MDRNAYTAGRKTRLRLFATTAAALSLAAGLPARAESLADAIAAAYQGNPAMQQARAQQRVTDEGYVQAKAGLRPTINVQVQAQRQDFDNVTSNSGQATIVANQPLYTGGRVSAAVSAAEADVLAGRESLRQSEASLLQAVVQAYADTLRDQESLAIEQKNLAALNDQLMEAQSRAKVGDLTRTDVAQSQGYVAQARAQLAQAKAQLEVSKAAYVAVIGHEPGALEALPPLPNMPATLDQAADTATGANPSLRAAQYSAQGAQMRTAEARRARLPSANLQFQFGGAGPVSQFAPDIYARQITALATVTMPIFSGGVINSQIRQQIEHENIAKLQVDENSRSMIQQLRQYWNAYQAAKEDIDDAAEQVKADEVAYTGVQKERQADLRSTLEVLSIEQSLFQAQQSEAIAKHDSYVAAANLLAAMGLLEAKILVPGVNLYDPVKAFNKVKNAGAVPWEILPEAIDGLGLPSLHRLPDPPTSLPHGN